MMIKVGIVGGSGYGAIELIRLLQTHPHITIAHIYSHSKVDEPLKLTFPHLQHIMQHFEALTVDNNDCDVIFFATPAPVSKTCIPPLVEKVFMLSIYLAHLELRIVKYMKHIIKKLLQHKMI